MTENGGKPMLNRAFFEGRRAAFFEEIGGNAIAVFEGASSGHSRFKQASDFFYLTGYSEPNAVCVLLATAEKRTFLLFVEPRDPAREQWDGVRPGPDGAKQSASADEAYSIHDLEKELPGLLKQARTLYASPSETPVGRKIVQLFHDSARSHGRTGSGVNRWEDASWILAKLRMRKTDDELAIIRHACAITREGYRAALDALKPGLWEYEIEALLDYTYRRLGGDGPAYPHIVGGGVNNIILHYGKNDCPLKDGELLLIDSAASYGRYTSDVTRTFPINGTFTEPQRHVYALVLRTQKAVIEATRPGISLKELNELAIRSLTEGMMELGWLKDKPLETLIEEKAYQPFYMHSIGHHLGLDVHDVGHAEADGKPLLLEPGMVFTVEPGLYISPDAEDVPDDYRGMGVRIEDTVLVTAEGCEILTTGIPKELADVEAPLKRA